MAFDIYTHIPGPNIPINLYADNFTAGINAGNALPSTTTAIINGLTKGLQTGQQIASNQQQLEIGQNQIDQLPVTNAQQAATLEQTEQQNQIRANQISQLPIANQMQQQQLTNAQLTNQVNQVKANIATQTENLQLKEAESKLKEEEAASTQKLNLINKTNQFNDQFQVSTPEQKAQLLFGGQYNDVFAADEKLFESNFRSVYPNLNPQQREAGEYRIGKQKTQSFYDKQAENHAQSFDKVATELSGNTSYHAVQNAIPLPPTEIPRALVEGNRFVPSGTFEETSPGSGIIKKDDSGNLVRIKDFDPKAITSWDVYWSNEKGGQDAKIVARNVSPKDKDLFENYVAEENWINGRNAQKGLQKFEEDFSSKNKKTQSTEQAPSPNISNDAQVQSRMSSFGQDYAPLKSGETLTPAALGAQDKPKANPKAIDTIPQIKIVTPNNTINLTENPAMYSVARETIGFSEKQFPAVEASFTKIFSLAEQGPKGFPWGYSSSQLAEFESSKNKISEQAVYRDWVEIPKEDKNKTYNDESVEKHNDIVRRFKAGLKSSSPLAPGLTEASLEASKLGIDLAQMQEVGTPFELYKLKSQGFYGELIGSMFQKLTEKVKAGDQARLKQGMQASKAISILNAPPSQ